MQQSLKQIISLTLAASLAFLSGCGAKPESAASKSILIYGSGDYTAINPALYEHGEINSLIFSGLTAHNSDNQVIPALAKSWEYDALSHTYTFSLREDVKWHDGQPFTADDAKFTLETIMNPANASEIASNYEEIIKIESLSANGESLPFTLRITLSAPNVALLDYLSVGVLPKHLLDGKEIATDPFNRHPIGTGPYKLTAWDVGQSITLEKNPDYYGGCPQIETILFKIVPDEKARAMQLISGELDLAQLSPQDAKSFAELKNFTIYKMKTSDYRGILYNFNAPLFKAHRELPNALSYAIDRQAIVESVLLGQGTPAYSPLQAGPYHDPTIEKFSYDPAKTKQALSNAGWEPDAKGIYTKDGDRLAFTINCGEGDQVRIDMANICAQQLREIGADVKVAVSPKIDWAGQDTYLIGWGSPFDPDDHTYKVFGTDKGSNFSAYSNDQVDRLLKQARETESDADRMRYYREFQQELTKDLPYTFLVYVDAIYVAKDTVKGITADTVLGHHGVGIFWNIADWTVG